MPKKNEMQKTQTAEVAGKPRSALAIVKKDVIDVVAKKITQLVSTGELHLPADYSAENALKAAWLALQSVEDKSGNKALATCTHDSVANSLLDMIVQGLNPAKDQCYFVVYGRSLVCMRSYFGTVALLKRVYGKQATVEAEVVYEDDTFKYVIENGRKKIVNHVQELKNIDNTKIVAAYAVVYLGNGHPLHIEIMPIDKIRKAWSMGAANGESPAHKGFTDEMAKKTVINRACKILINSSDDQYLIRALERQAVSMADAEVNEAAEDEANAKLIDFDTPPLALPGDQEPTGDVAGDDPDRGEDSEDVPVELEQSEPIDVKEDGSGKARFNRMVEELELDPTIARKTAAHLLRLDDVRKLGNTEFERVMTDAEGFLFAYEEGVAAEEARGKLPGMA